MEKLSSSDQKRAQIRAREKYEMDKKSEIYCAREEGIKEGLEQGKQEGIKEGEKRKMKELILNMSNQGLDNEFIAKCLSIDINTLKQLLNN